MHIFWNYTFYKKKFEFSWAFPSLTPVRSEGFTQQVIIDTHHYRLYPVYWHTLAWICYLKWLWLQDLSTTRHQIEACFHKITKDWKNLLFYLEQQFFTPSAPPPPDHQHHISTVFQPPPPPPYFHCFPPATPQSHLCCFPSTTTTTFPPHFHRFTSTTNRLVHLQIAHDLILTTNLPHFNHEIKTKRYDIIGVHEFLLSLMTFRPKKRPNWSLLHYWWVVKN